MNAANLAEQFGDMVSRGAAAWKREAVSESPSLFPAHAQGSLAEAYQRLWPLRKRLKGLEQGLRQRLAAWFERKKLEGYEGLSRSSPRCLSGGSPPRLSSSLSEVEPQSRSVQVALAWRAALTVHLSRPGVALRFKCSWRLPTGGPRMLSPRRPRDPEFGLLKAWTECGLVRDPESERGG